MTNKQIIKKVAAIVQKKFEKESSGHDWYHIERVWKLANKIARREKADSFITELSALLHDIADYKLNNFDDKLGAKEARKILEKFKVAKGAVNDVCNIIDRLSFKGGTEKRKLDTLEGKIVWDADKLDALGAIGIARAFVMGGHFGRPMHDPKVKPRFYKSFYQYKKYKGTTINHFYEKLLLLKGRMNTKTGKKIAEERHKFMENYLKQFYKEWKGEA